MKVKLTNRYLETHRPARREEVFDVGGPPGFGARVGPRATTFFLVYWRNGSKHRAKIGDYSPDGDGKNTFTLAQARTEAERLRGTKSDPAGDRRRAREVGTFGDVARRFLEELPRAKKRADEPGLRPLTALTYRRQLENQLIPELGERPFTGITRYEIEEYLEGVARETPIQANRLFALLRRLFNWGIRRGYVEVNPCAALEPPGGAETPHEKDWTDAELKAVLEALEKEDPVTRSLFRLAFLTGCRRGELLRAEWAWVDLEKELLHVPAEANKAGRKKDVVLVRQAVELLGALRTITAPSPWLFPNGDAHLATVTKQTRRIGDRAGVSFRFHDLRDAVANWLHDHGATIDVVKHVLGHVVATGATKSYLRATALPDQRRALQRWADHLEALVSGERAKVVSIGKV